MEHLEKGFQTALFPLVEDTRKEILADRKSLSRKAS